MNSPESPKERCLSATLAVEGMSCGHCVQAVINALTSVPGVAVGSVSLGNAQFTAPDGPTIDRAIAAVEEAGFSARIDATRAGTTPRASDTD